MKKIITLLFFILPALSFTSFAVDSPSSNQPVLTISGFINGEKVRQSIDFDLLMLETMPSHTLQTVTSWTSGVQTFKGVLLNKLIDSISMKGDLLTAYALNDNYVDIPVSDFENYPVIIAYQKNGKYMAVRNKGPLWIIYPESDFPELDRPTIKNRWIWQLRKISIQ